MRKGFTLIELLAVIVILAVIAVIAVPIVLNIINDSKESAILRSADFYLSGVENAIATSMLHNIQVKDGTYSITKEGDICLGLLDNEGNCNEVSLKVEIDGEKPTTGSIKIKDGQIYKVYITISDKEVSTNLFTGTLEYKLAPGLYDENDNLIASWEELVNKYDIKKVIEQGYNYDDGDYLVSDILMNYENESKLVIDDSVTSIGSLALSGCTSLEEVIIPENVTSIGDMAFFNCTDLKEIKIPDSVLVIESETFSGCKNLVSVIIGESVTRIVDSAFSGCTGLTSITISESVTNIEPYAFNGCKNLSSIKVDENNNVYDSRDNSNAIIETETNTLIVGGNNTVIPNSIIRIGWFAFLGRSKTSITIPSSVITIDYDAFYGYANLTTIYYKGTAPGFPWGATNATLIKDF